MEEKTVYFEDVFEGMELPPRQVGPVVRQQLVDYASASGDYNKLHYDESFANKAGLKTCIGHGMLSMATLGTYLTNWAVGGTLKSFKVRFSGMTFENDLVTSTGKITRKFIDNNEYFVEIVAQNETQNNIVATQGSAVIKLKSKNS